MDHWHINFHQSTSFSGGDIIAFRAIENIRGSGKWRWKKNPWKLFDCYSIFLFFAPSWGLISTPLAPLLLGEFRWNFHYLVRFHQSVDCFSSFVAAQLSACRIIMIIDNFILSCSSVASVLMWSEWAINDEPREGLLFGICFCTKAGKRRGSKLCWAEITIAWAERKREKVRKIDGIW